MLFEEYFGVAFAKGREDWLINPETNRPLELDGYNEELKLAFEYDGEQHYNPIELWGGKAKLKTIQILDAIKDKLCKDNEVHLIRIPYWEKVNLESFILEELRSYQT